MHGWRGRYGITLGKLCLDFGGAIGVRGIGIYRMGLEILEKCYPGSEIFADRCAYFSELLVSVGKYSEASKQLEISIEIY